MRSSLPASSLERPADGTRYRAQRVNWWLRLTSSGWDRPQRTIAEREKVRRSRLTSWVILGLLVTDVLLVPTVGTDQGTLIAVAVAGIGLIIAVLLNRSGLVTAAGILLILLICGGVLGAVASDPTGLDTVDLPAYDLLAIAVVVAASVLPRAAAFGVAALNAALICLDFFVQRPGVDLRQALAAYGALALLARPIALQILLATVAYLWVRGTDDAIRRADRAEEIAAMEHELAEQKRQLDFGIRQILDTHVRVANGDFGARAPLTQDNILFQISASLNNLLNRLSRAAQAEHLYQRTLAEIIRLRDSLLAARSGRAPLWPAPSGTPVDSLIEVIAGPGRPATASQMSGLDTTGRLRGPNSGGNTAYPIRGAPGEPLPPAMSYPMSYPMGSVNSGPFTGIPTSPSISGGMSGYQPTPPSAPRRPDLSGWGAPGPASGPGSGAGSGADVAPPPPSNDPWEMPPLPDWPELDDPTAEG